MKKCCIFILFILLFSLAPAFTTATPVEIKYFYSPSCSHCRVVSRIMEDVSEQYENLVSVNRINVALPGSQDIWNQYKMQFAINGVPTIIINDEFKLEGDIKITLDKISDIVDELLQGMDSRGDELYNMGTSALQSGQFEMASSYFDQAIEIYGLSGNTTKIALCNQKIFETATHMDAKVTYVEAENYYYAAAYSDALPLYDEVIGLYLSIGATNLTQKSDIRRQSCLFFITYGDALAAYGASEWDAAIGLFRETMTYTSDVDVVTAINGYISHATSQLDALDLFAQGEAAFEATQYADAKLLYQDASHLFSDSVHILLCNERLQLCDSIILASDTFDYAVSLYDGASYQEAIAVFASAKEKYVELGDTESASACESYIGLSQAALDDIERQERAEQQAVQDARNKKMLFTAAISALVVIMVSLALLLFSRRSSPALLIGGALDESEDASEGEEDDRESQEID